MSLPIKNSKANADCASFVFPQFDVGSTHGSELPFVFGAPLSPGLWKHVGHSFGKADAAVSRTVMTYWANFAKTG